jgi:uncharacterized integral membrane protein
MRKFLNIVLLVPLGLVFVVFAVANRHAVTVSFDPFDTRDPSLALSLPLFVVILTMAILGVIAGGIATWIAQRHWRRAARRHQLEAERANRDVAELRATIARQTMARAALPQPVVPSYDALPDRPRLTL